MPRLSIVFKRSLIFVHRWLGVALSALFLLWFLSGIVMMYWSYPEVTAQDRLRRLPKLDPAGIQLNGEEAGARLGQPIGRTSSDKLRRTCCIPPRGCPWPPIRRHAGTCVRRLR
jgi:hypothetical protein